MPSLKVLGNISRLLCAATTNEHYRPVRSRVEKDTDMDNLLSEGFDPRATARSLMLESMPQRLQTENESFCRQLTTRIKTHQAYRHPVYSDLRAGKITREQLIELHLEFRAAVVTVFTDALLMAQFHTRQLEKRFGPASQMPARFLITLNILDEFGFQPGHGANNYFRGTPKGAHYQLYDEVVRQLGVDSQTLANYQGSPRAQEIRGLIESEFGEFSSLLGVLMATEELAMVFCPAMREASKRVWILLCSRYRRRRRGRGK